MLKLNYSFCMNDYNSDNDSFLDSTTLDSLIARHKDSFNNAIADITSNKYGFGLLPEQILASSGFSKINKLVGTLKKRFVNMVVIGIGGSSLGAKAVFNAIKKEGYFTSDTKNAALYFLENTDPSTIAALLKNIDINKTVFNVISKSGGTVEPSGTFSYILSLLKQKFDDWRSRIIITTDPESGLLKEFADKEQIEQLEIPKNVGGRFSVFSSVGLFPLLMSGVNIEELLKGAIEISKKCMSSDLKNNPSFIFAIINYYYFTVKKRNILVFMPYSDVLNDISMWFRQLWAESLGKNKTIEGKKIKSGSTPVSATGSIDQHSQMQLYMEGPQDKLVCFLEAGKIKNNIIYPSGENGFAPAGYLESKTMADLLTAECLGSKTALLKEKRPSVSIKIEEINEFNIGALMQMLMFSTVFEGYMLNINPYNQPGVELGKNYAYGLMGKPGYDEYAEYIKKIVDNNSKYSC